MKKLVSLALALMIAAGIVSGCGCAKQENPATSTPAEATEAAPGSETASEGELTTEDKTAPAEAPATEGEAAPQNTDASLPEVSQNTEVVSKEEAPKVVMVKNATTNEDSLTYHLESCSTLEGKESQEVSWEMVQMVGFWQCPTCNPPRYEDYKNAD